MQVRRVLIGVGVGTLCLLGLDRTGRGAELELDLTSITAQAQLAGVNSAFIPAFTGSVVLGKDSNAALSAVRLDGSGQTISGILTGISGQINLVAGDVTGGSGTVTVTDSGTPRSYSFTIVPDLLDPGQNDLPPYDIFGLTNQGTFSSSSFAGFNLTPYAAYSPYSGDFDLENYNPATVGPSIGFSANADLSLIVELPEPASATIFVGFVTAGLIKRNRRV